MPSPLRFASRRMGPVGLALTALDIWRRIPPRQRKQIVEAARKHGPRVASEMLKRAQRARPPRPRP